MAIIKDENAMARALRAALARRQVALSHDECLSIVAEAAPFADAASRISDLVPILRIFSLEKAREFYVDFLGFGVDWEHRFEPAAPVYMQVSRDRAILHLSEHHGDGTPGATVFVWMRGIEAFHRELLARDYPYCRPGLEAAPWDARLMQVADPFGNRLRFSEPNRAEDPRA